MSDMSVSSRIVMATLCHPNFHIVVVLGSLMFYRVYNSMIEPDLEQILKIQLYYLVYSLTPPLKKVQEPKNFI